jgi:hypothetical protein
VPEIFEVPSSIACSIKNTLSDPMHIPTPEF